MDLITHERVLALLDYHPETGEFYWRRSKGRARAGSKAGRISKPGNGLQYIIIGLDSQEYLAHRLAYFYVTGAWPAGRIEFVDQNGLNVAFSNLRAVSRSGPFPDLTAEIVRELLHYDPESGVFRWRRRDIKWFDSHQLCNAFNTRFAGREAGMPKSDQASPGYVYLDICLLGTHYHAARLAFLHMTGRWPRPTVDHANGNPLNNRWSNLREATFTQNASNRKAQKNATGFKGVSRRWKNGKPGSYRAHITYDGRRINLGSFPTAEEAHAAYLEAAERYHGEFTRDRKNQEQAPPPGPISRNRP